MEEVAVRKKNDFIDFMIESDVLMFGDFTTKSGRKTPFFVNTGKYCTGKQMSVLGFYYASTVIDSLGRNFDVLFGPAYKGIPLITTTAAALYKEFDMNVPVCYNRKEVKDHGEKGRIVGHKLKDGDRVVIIEDVTTAGTSIRETVPLLKKQADVKIAALVISVDRMERGQGSSTAVQELESEFGLKACSIVKMNEVVEYLHNNPVNGKKIVDDRIKESIDRYYEKYGVAK
ncbi:MAG: orotate phosphoribosyltransferase [bacterium]